MAKRKVYYAKNGRPYIKLKSGKAKFIKGKTRKSGTVKRRVRKVTRRSVPKKRKVNKSRMRRSTTMARRKRTSRRKRSTSRSKNVLGMSGKDLIDVVAVGAGSGFIDGAINTLTSMLPINLSGVPTQLLQAGGGLLIRKFVPGKFGLKRIMKAYAKFKLTDAAKDLIGGIAYGTTTNGGSW